MANKRNCILCPSHEYEYCGKCKPDKIVETWRFIFDSENCRDIYKVIEKYVAKKVTALEARKQLEKYELPNFEDIQSSLRKSIEEIFELTKNEYNKNTSVEEMTTNEKNDFEERESSQESEKEIVKPRRRRFSRRNFD